MAEILSGYYLNKNQTMKRTFLWCSNRLYILSIEFGGNKSSDPLSLHSSTAHAKHIGVLWGYKILIVNTSVTERALFIHGHVSKNGRMLILNSCF